MLRVLLRCVVLLRISCTAAGNPSSTVIQVPKSAVTRGAEVTLYCIYPIFSDKKPVKVHWWRDGADGFLEESADSRFQFYFLNQGGAAFKLVAVRAEDAGLYYCRLTHSAVVNGTGTELVVYDPPTPLQVNRMQSESRSPGPLILVCTTAAFFPDDLNITWYKNGSEIGSGMESIKWRNLAGLYEASSYLNETQPVESGTVYTCQVSHISLRTSANVSYTFCHLDYENYEDKHYPLIFGCLGAGLITLLSVIFIVKRRGTCRKQNERIQRNEQTIYTEANERLTYATLNLAGTQKINTPRCTDESTIYAQTKHGASEHGAAYNGINVTDSCKTAKQ